MDPRRIVQLASSEEDIVMGNLRFQEASRRVWLLLSGSLLVIPSCGGGGTSTGSDGGLHTGRRVDAGLHARSTRDSFIGNLSDDASSMDAATDGARGDASDSGVVEVD